MSKRLAIIGKWLFGAVLIVGAITGVAYAYYQASVKYQRECEEQASRVGALSTQKTNRANDCQDPKDYMPWGYVLIAWPEGITVWAIIFTLIAIAVQTYHTRRSAEASLKQANYLVGSERAWILVEEILPPKDLVPPSVLSQEELQRQAESALANDPEYQAANLVDRWEKEMLKREEIRANAAGMVGLWVLMCGFRFKVFGNTHAKLTESALIFRVVEGRVRGRDTEANFPAEPDYGAAAKAEEIPGMGTILAPGFRFTSGIPLWGGKLSPQEIVDIGQRRQFLCSYGFVRYRDAFEGTPVRETRFCYVYDVTRGGGVLIDPETKEPVSPNAFRVGGPTAYNRAT
jgi:hypothetical protein